MPSKCRRTEARGSSTSDHHWTKRENDIESRYQLWPEGLYMGANIFELYRKKLSLDRDSQHSTCRNVGEVLAEEGVAALLLSCRRRREIALRDYPNRQCHPLT